MNRKAYLAYVAHQKSLYNFGSISAFIYKAYVNDFMRRLHEQALEMNRSGEYE